MNIEITVANRIAAVVGSPVIVCGNKGYTVTFSFDREWDGYDEKTARFVFIVDGKAKFIDVLFSGNTCDAPMLSNISQVVVGVYAGDLRTTTGATIKCLKSILCGGGTHEEPPEDVYNQILENVSTKVSSRGGTLTGNFFLEGNEFIHEGNLYLLEPYLDNVLSGRNITETASGNAITIESSQAPLQNLKLFGKTTQDGTPTPDNPIELKSVGDSGSFEVGVYGKNIVNDTINTTYTNGGITFSPNGNGGTNVAGTTITNAYPQTLQTKHERVYTHGIDKIYVSVFTNITKGRVMVSQYDENGTKLINAPFQNGVNQVFQLNKNCNYITFFVLLNDVASGLGIDGYIRYNVSLEPNVTEYEPCNKQSSTFTDTLRGIGDIADEKDFARGVKIQRFEVLNAKYGAWQKSGGVTNVFHLLGVSPLYSKCTHFEENNDKRIVDNVTAETYLSDGQYCANVNLGRMYVKSTQHTTLEEFTTWLSNNNVMFVCECATPIETPLTETELNAYRHLMTNKGNTTILSEADMSVTYYPDNDCAQSVGNVHSEMRSMMNTLTQAIISVGGAE